MWLSTPYAKQWVPFSSTDCAHKSGETAMFILPVLASAAPCSSPESQSAISELGARCG